MCTEQVFLSSESGNNILYYIPVLASMINFSFIGLCLGLIFNKLKSNVALICYLAGFASRFIMGFSPTVFASSERTIIFFDFAMIICSILIWQELIKKQEKTDLKIQNRTLSLIKILGCMEYINVLFCILFTQK